MKKIATVVALALSATSVKSACTANWITTDAGIVSLGDTAASNVAFATSPNFATCGVIKAGAKSCCATTEVAKFQAKADALVEELKTAVSTRDKFIMDRRGDVLKVRDSLNSIQESITKLSKDSSVSIGDSLEAFFTGYTDMISTFTEDFADLKAAFITYQKNRVTCFNKLVQAQVAIWCAACNEDPTTQGLTAQSTISYGTTFTNAVAGACSAYVASAIEQSEILSLYYVSDYLATLASALSKLANGDATGAATELAEFFTDYTGMTAPTKNLEKPALSVGACASTGCSWLTSTLFTQGVLDTDLAAVGGSYTAITSRRLQAEVEAPAGRMLQFNIDPATEAAGITVAFPENPGSVDNDQNSAMRNGAIACAITALAALL